MEIEKIQLKVCKEISKIWKKTKGLNLSLVGEVGAGKTFFVRQLVAYLCPDLIAEVCSPTFSYFNIYKNKSICFHHFDLYRIQDSEKLEEIGLWESIDDKNSITVIEWADLFPDVLKACNLKLNLYFEGDKRQVVLENKMLP